MLLAVLYENMVDICYDHSRIAQTVCVNESGFGFHLRRLPPTATRSAPDGTGAAAAPATAVWPAAECAAPGRRAEFGTNR